MNKNEAKQFVKDNCPEVEHSVTVIRIIEVTKTGKFKAVIAKNTIRVGETTEADTKLAAMNLAKDLLL